MAFNWNIKNYSITFLTKKRIFSILSYVLIAGHVKHSLFTFTYYFPFYLLYFILFLVLVCASVSYVFNTSTLDFLFQITFGTWGRRHDIFMALENRHRNWNRNRNRNRNVLVGHVLLLCVVWLDGDNDVDDAEAEADADDHGLCALVSNVTSGCCWSVFMSHPLKVFV